MLHLLASCLVVLVACARGGEPQAPATTGPTCASVMPKMTQAAIKGVEDGGAGEDVMVQVRRDAELIEPQLVQACIADAWSTELLACIDTTPVDDLERCEAFVTPAQLERVIQLREAQASEVPD
jgi:hypothetical protein